MTNMKSIKIIIISIICLTLGFQNTNAQEANVQFGIYETVPLNDIRPFSESLSKYILNQNLKMDAPVLGYISTNDKSFTDSLFVESGSPEMNLMLTRVQPSRREPYAVIALRENPTIIISDINKTIPSEKSIEIRFTYKGAKKWAKMTKQNVGKMVAFVINDEIWSLPLVNAEIKSGVAMITGLESMETAKKISELINSSL